MPGSASRLPERDVPRTPGWKGRNRSRGRRRFLPLHAKGTVPFSRRKRRIIGQTPLCRENWDSPRVNGYELTLIG